MDNSHANPLPLQRDLILGLLLALAAIAWAVAHLAERERRYGYDDNEFDDWTVVIQRWPTSGFAILVETHEVI